MVNFNDLATDDFQNRHKKGSYPKSGVPDVIEVCGNNVQFLFKNTSEDVARKWVSNYLKCKGFNISKISSHQIGDYHDDWVEVKVSGMIKV